VVLTSPVQARQIADEAFPGLPFMESRSGFSDHLISNVVGRHITEDLLRGLIGEQEYPVDSMVIADCLRLDYRLDKTPFQEASQAMMDEFRDLGFLKACPNISTRGILAYKAWNDWLRGDHYAKYDHQRFEQIISMTHAFSAFERATRKAFSEMKVENMPRDIDGRRLHGEKVLFARHDVNMMINDIVSKVRENFLDPNIDPLETFDSGLDRKCKMTGRNVHTMGSTFAPVLGGPNPDNGYKFEIFEDIAAPNIVQHLVMPLPSGKVMIADDFREIEGFQEGLEALIGEDYFEMGNAKGMDDMVEAYFAKAGMVRVFTTTSPSAYEDGDGIWRVGFVDEENDRFYNDDTRNDDTRNDVEMPKKAWQAETTVWANILVDPETLSKIVFSSGQYQSIEDAAAACTEFQQEGGRPLVDIGADELHVYMPTGYGLQGDNRFNETFKAVEIRAADWREDTYIISSTELTVDPDLILDRPYEAASLNVDLSHNETPEP